MLDVRWINDGFAVAPQIEAADFEALREEGFCCVVDNRPDGEEPGAMQSDEAKSRASAVGLNFHYEPIDHSGFDMGQIERLRAVLNESNGPILAYCRSGTRSSMLWALASAGRLATDEIIRLGADAGYDLSGLSSTIETLAKNDKDPQTSAE